MRVFLHIGMSKAGSTAIQRCLVRHQDALARAGVCFPDAGRLETAHYELFTALRDGEAARADAVAQAMLAEAAAAGADALIVSVEGLWLLADDAVRALAQLFDGHEVQVVLYLRRPDTYLTSSYRQRIKRKRSPQSVRAYLREPHAHLRYDHVLERWARHFPLRVRAYENVRSDLVGDFARATGTDGVLHCPPGKRANVTPSDGSLRLMRLANRWVPHQNTKRAVTRWLLARQAAFAWMPALDDAPLVERARAEAARWDRKGMARHLSPDDLAAITPRTG